MERESRRAAAIILLVLPTVMFGGASLLYLILLQKPGYLDNPVRQTLWRAGHAHAGVFLVLSLVLLRYVDECALSTTIKSWLRYSTPTAAILIPFAFFCSVLLPTSTEPNQLIYFGYLGAIVLGSGILTIGYGLLKKSTA